MDSYDCTNDVMAHKRRVKKLIDILAFRLAERGISHDNSKLEPPEKEGFDKWTPELKQRTFGSDYYKEALDSMGEFLQHHYAVNSHHPEHFADGVDGMNLLDVIEMISDWCAAAQAKGVKVDLDHAATRFNLSPQLKSIIAHTLKDLE